MNGGTLRALEVACLALLVACTRLEAEVGSEPPVSEAGASNAAASGGANCDSAAPLELYYWNARPAATTDQIDFLVKLENRSGAAVPLATLSVRYYFTDEIVAPATLEVYYGDTCCSNKILFKDEALTSVQAVSASPRADSYFEIGFDPSLGALAAGDSVQVELGYHDAAFDSVSTQSNDYSFVATAVGTQADWDACPGPACLPTFTNCRLSAYREGTLVWGMPP